jgi:CHAD domain-containing protein
MLADEVFVDALRAEVREHATKLDERLKRASRGSVGGVHDARTLSRRLRSELDILARTAGHAKRSSKVMSRVKRTEKALSRARDLDVLRLDVEGYTAMHPSAEDGLAGLRELVTKKRRRARAEVARVLSKKRRRKLCASLERLAAKAAPPVAKGAVARPSPALVRDFTHEEIWRRYDAVRAFEAALPGSEDLLHQFRAACRKLRFTMELFQAALPDSSPIIDDLVALQDQIGEMHDHHVAITEIRTWKARGDLRSTPELETYVAERLLARERSKEHFEARWLAHLCKDFRLRLAEAIDEETPASA